MRLWERLQSLLGLSRSVQTRAVERDRVVASEKGAVDPQKETTSEKRAVEPVRLEAISETALSNALRALEPGQQGWISFDDAARLFSPAGEHPSELDPDGVRALGDFAAQIEHRSTPKRNAGQQRVYFTRIRTLNL